MTDAPAISIRAAVPDDLAFIFSAWLKSYRTAPAIAMVPSKLYFAGQHDRIAGILGRSGCLVAHPEGDADTILGFAVIEPHKPTQDAVGPSAATVHWVYVKHAFRHLGIATRLLAGVDLSRSNFTHFPIGGEWIAGTCPGLTFNPFAAVSTR